MCLCVPVWFWFVSLLVVVCQEIAVDDMCQWLEMDFLDQETLETY